MTYTCPEIASLVEEACEEFRSLLTGRALDTNGFDRAMARIHATEASERLKLLDKDQLLIDNIDIFKRAVRRFFRQGQITFPEAQLLIAVATLFGNVESILWELKGEEGPVPPPTPRPEEPEPPRPNPDGPPIIPPDDGSPVIGEDGNQDAGNWDNGDAIEQEGDGEDDGDVGWDCHCQGSRLLVLMGPMELK